MLHRRCPRRSPSRPDAPTKAYPARSGTAGEAAICRSHPPRARAPAAEASTHRHENDPSYKRTSARGTASSGSTSPDWPRCSRSWLGGEIAALTQVCEDLPGRVFGAAALGVDDNLGLLRGFVWIIDAGKPFELTGARLLVQTLGIALLRGLERDVDVHLDELARLHAGADRIPVLAIWRDEAGDGDHAGVREKLGHLPDPADVLGAILGGKSQVLVQPVADVVAVEPVGMLLHVKQHLLEDDGDGGFAAGAQARHPDRHALLPEKSLALLAGDGTFVPGDVRCFLFGHFCQLSVVRCQLQRFKCPRVTTDDRRRTTDKTTPLRTAGC